MAADLEFDAMGRDATRRDSRASEVRMPDALVAATALEHGLELMTRNRRDFDRIRDLRVRSPNSR